MSLKSKTASKPAFRPKFSIFSSITCPRLIKTTNWWLAKSSGLIGISWMSKKPSGVLMVEPNSLSRLEMAKIKHFSNEIQVSLNYTYSEIFEILGVDYQMSTTCYRYKLHRSSKKAYFSCVISIYFCPSFMITLYTKGTLKKTPSSSS